MSRMSANPQNLYTSDQVDTTNYSHRGVDAFMAEVKQKRTGRCLLALDGGGIRGFSQIAILHEISKRIKYDQGLEEWPCLCDYFDMIGGVGTGGYVAILIGRLGLITPVVKEEFLALLAQSLAGPIELTQLDNWLRELVKRHTGDPETLMFDPSSPTNHCKTFISASTAASIAYLTKLRSYEVREGSNFNPPIWQVIRATLAHPSLFPGIKIGPDLINQVYISGELGWNNPSHEVIKEFESQWKQQKISCLANIGTGHEGVIQIEEIDGSIVPASLSVALERMAADSERIAHELVSRFQGRNTYYRLSVEHGLGRNNQNKPVTLEEVVAHTNSYLCSSGVSVLVDALVASLLYYFELPRWSITKEHFEESLDWYLMKAKGRVDEMDITETKAAAQEVVVTLEKIRNTASNEEHWLMLVKVIDDHFNSIAQNVNDKPYGSLSMTPLWDSINYYFNELRNVQKDVSPLLKLNSHQIWGVPMLEPFLSKCVTKLEGCFKRVQVAIINDIHDRTYQRDQDKEMKKLLGWLSPLEPQRRHDDVQAKRSQGTGTWFINMREFQDWCHVWGPQRRSVLCGFGEPGAGKTVMCSSVIDYLRKRYFGQFEVGIAGLYCDYRDQENQTILNIIGGLAKQLIRKARSIPDAVWEVFKERTEENRPINLEAAQEIFGHMLRTFSLVYVCIDALDECEPQSRRKFLQYLKGLIHSPLHVFLTGRQNVEAEVTNALANLYPQIIPIVANEEDIRLFLSQKIDEDPYPEAMDETLEKEIIEKIVGLSHGTFLLPILQIQSVLEHDTKRDRRISLLNTPSELFDTYTTTFERIKRQPGAKPQRALAILTWVCLSQRQLDVDEIQCALAVKPEDTTFDTDGIPSESSLVECCLGLVVVETGTSSVRLTHFTLQEYFNQYWTNLFPLGHTTIAATCLTYLNLSHPISSRWEMKRLSPLIDYVAYNVGHHLRMGSNPRVNHQAVATLNRKNQFRLLETFFEDLLNSYSPFYGELKTFPLHWVAYFGAASIGKVLLDSVNISMVNLKDVPNGRTPLSYAAENGHVQMIQLLLDKNDVVVDSKDRSERTPLSYAAQNGHTEVVRLLAGAQGVEKDSRDESRRTPLLHAVKNGCEGVVRLLVGIPCVDVNSRDQSEWTPLLYAVQHGHEGVVRLLAGTPSIDINSKDRYKRTPLWHAAYHGHEGIVQLLIDTPGVHIDSNHRSPLFPAVSRRHEGVVRLLVGIPGMGINSKDGYERTPLSYAAEYGLEGIVRLLIGVEGMNVNLRGQFKRTALWYAADCGREGVVRLLVNAPGIEVDLKCPYGRSALSYAAERGHDGVVRLLVGTPGVDVDSKDQSGRTPLSYAAEYGRGGVFRLLVGTLGVDLDSQNECRQTPLSYAAKSGHEEIVQLLIDTPNVDVNSKCQHRRSPLSYAAEYGHEGVVRLLINTSDIDIDSSDQFKRTALSYAAERGHEGVVRLLVDTPGVDINSKGQHRRSPILYAVLRGHEGVVRLLVGTPGVNADSRDQYKRTPLSYAAEYGYKGTVRLLLGTPGVKADSSDQYKRTPLSYAAEYGNEAVVQLLVDAPGVDVNSRDQSNRTPLLYAVMRDHNEVVRLLQDHHATYL